MSFPILKKIIIINILSISLFFPVFSQQTFISGQITDATTNDPIPFANVFFKGTTIGTTSDFEGFFKIQTYSPKDSLTVQFLGYKPKSKIIVKKITQVIDFQIFPSVFQLGEVVIVPGENPAHPILRNVMKHKKDHNINRIPAYEYECYSKVEASIDNITDKFRRKRLMRPLAYLFDSMQVAAGEDGQPILPIFLSESLSDVYFLKDPKRKKEVIKANSFKGVGFNEGSYITQLLGSSFQEYNFNDNWLQILDKNFISPIARGGLAYYKYYLIDSMYIDNKFCYEIKVKPKREEDLAFHGTIWIHDTSFALKRISVEISESADLNFIDRIRIQQDLEPASLNIWTPTKTRVLVDVEQLSDSSFGVLGKFYVSNSNYKFNQPKDLIFYEDKIEVEENASDHDAEYWQEHRHEMIDATGENIYGIIDSIKKFPKIRTYLDIAEIIIEGHYKIARGFEIGPYILLYGNNEIEGHRFRIGLRSNENFIDKLKLGGHLAYGTKDEKFKFGVHAEYFFSKKNWTKIGIQYTEDVDGVGINQDFVNTRGNLFNFSKQIGYIDKMNRIRLARIGFQSDFLRGFTGFIGGTYKKLTPLGENYVIGYYTDETRSRIKSEVTTTEAYIKARYAPRATWIVTPHRRIGVGAKKAPVITLAYTRGIKGLFESDFDYDKLSLSISQKVKLFGIGRFQYTVTGTKNFTKLPYPLLYVLAGNETYFLSKNSYSLMNFFEFVTDQYAELNCLHHFDGLLFNKVPFLKKLNWRAVLSANIVYGTLKDENFFYSEDNPNGILVDSLNGRQSTRFTKLDLSEPYIEVSYGIENILKFIRIDFFHRLTYLHEDAPRFGVKASAFFTF